MGAMSVRYKLHAHRIVEGFYEETGRAGAELTTLDRNRVKHLSPLSPENLRMKVSSLDRSRMVGCSEVIARSRCDERAR